MKSPLLIVRVALLSVLYLLAYGVPCLVNRCKSFPAFLKIKWQPVITFQLSRITSQSLEILKNTEIIAINQDPVVGTAITPFRWGINVRGFPLFQGFDTRSDADDVDSLTGRTITRTQRSTGAAKARTGLFSCLYVVGLLGLRVRRKGHCTTYCS